MLPPRVRLGEVVAAALKAGRPVVALETAVVTHGLPAPCNFEAMYAMEDEIRAAGATPATCLVQNGELWIGAVPEQVEAVAQDAATDKASFRDLGAVLASGRSAGLTVSASLFASQLAGIGVLATGGIGGVHLGSSGDVSADLHQLARSPVITVCSGAKSVLDIPRTLEYLEALGVPVFAYRSLEFPAFYLESSGQPARPLASVQAIVETARMQWALGYGGGLVIANPIARDHALQPKEWARWLEDAQRSADAQHIHGKELTPYLLARVAESSNRRTVEANLALLKGNAHLAAELAVALSA